MFKKVLCILFIAAAFAGAARAEDVTLPNPLKNVKTGQWIKLRMFTLFGYAEQVQRVVNIQGEGDERVITVNTEVNVDGEVVNSEETSIAYQQAVDEQMTAFDDAEDVKYSNITTTVNGKQMSAVQIDFVQDGQKCTLVLSEEVPLTGMIRIEIDGMDEPAMELLDFGE